MSTIKQRKKKFEIVKTDELIEKSGGTEGPLDF